MTIRKTARRAKKCSGQNIWKKLEGHKLLENIFKNDACKENLRNMFTSNDTNASLQGRYRRIINGAQKNPPEWKVCKQWNDNPLYFKAWFIKRYHEQKDKCEYCGFSTEEVRIKYNRPNGFREGNGNGNGTRGWTLEVERQYPQGDYEPNNCVLSCYPCNNSKSDVFIAKEFIIIGAVIRALKTNTNCKNLKNNKFIKGLINQVEKSKKAANKMAGVYNRKLGEL